MCASVVRAWSASSDSAYVRMSVSNCWIVRPPKRTILVSKATTQKRSPCRMTKMPDAPLCHVSKRELYLISIVRFLLTHPASLLRLSMCKRIFDLLHAIWHVWHAQPRISTNTSFIVIVCCLGCRCSIQQQQKAKTATSLSVTQPPPFS